MPELDDVYFWTFGSRIAKKKNQICMLGTGIVRICDIHQQSHSHDFSALTLHSGLAIKERIGQL